MTGGEDDMKFSSQSEWRNNPLQHLIRIFKNMCTQQRQWRRCYLLSPLLSQTGRRRGFTELWGGLVCVRRGEGEGELKPASPSTETFGSCGFRANVFQVSRQAVESQRC